MSLYLYTNPFENSLEDVFNFDNDDLFTSLIPNSMFAHPCPSRISRRIRHNNRWSPYKKLEKKLKKFFNEENEKLVDFTPKINLTEDEKKYYIHADLPGMTKDQIKMELNEDHVLTISGERKSIFKTGNDNSQNEDKGCGNPDSSSRPWRCGHRLRHICYG